MFKFLSSSMTQNINFFCSSMLFALLGLMLPSFFTLKSDGFGNTDPKEIVRRAEQKMQGIKTSQGTLKMSIVRPKWSKSITLKTWTKGQQYTLLVITSPEREKGTAFLKQGKELWNWQPKIGKAIKLPPSMMAQNWMGSDFSNDLLVKQASLTEDYTHKLLGSEKVDGRDCHKIELTPKADAAVVWGKITTWISKTDDLQLKSEFYDEDDYLVNTVYGKNIKTLGGKTITTLLEVIPAGEDNQKTTVEYLDLTFDKDISDSFFTVENMKNVAK